MKVIKIKLLKLLIGVLNRQGNQIVSAMAQGHLESLGGSYES